MKNNNRNYDPNVFVVSTQRKDVALLPGIGKFCLCGCGKEIKGKLITKILYGKKVTYFKRPGFNQKFATPYCEKKYYNTHNRQESKSSVLARIPILPTNDSRIITVYTLDNTKRKVAITKNDKALWRLMNQLQKNIMKGESKNVS